MKTVFDFLKDLKNNNNREWFQANKKRYDAAKREMEQLSASLIRGIHLFDPGISEINPKDTLFRIYRDVRFSKDKSPYKTNIGSFIVKGGKKSDNAGYYLHIEPGNSFIGGGIHMPAADVLRKIRDEIVRNTDEFKSIIGTPGFTEHFQEISGDSLSRPPKGFDPDFKDINLIKYKSYTVIRPLTDGECLEQGFDHFILESFKEMKDFIEFLNRAINP